MHIVLKIAAIAIALLLTVHLVPGITLSGGWMTVIVASVVWAVIITVIRPVLRILTLPLNIVTLGLFSFVLNALLFYGMTIVVPGFVIVGIIPALLGALVLSIASSLIMAIL
jgi:putative membrane protein